ncbi:MAG: response regulator [Gemmatimonadales bacterium]
MKPFPPHPPSAPPPPAPTVLVVDDEAGLRRVLERFLARHGYRVLSAGTAESAYEALASEHADALLLDIHLPTMSGLALYLAIIHRWPALEGRIAIMTGDADAENVRTWLEHHRCQVIRKPFNLQEVSDWVAHVLGPRDRATERGAGAMDA